MEGIKRRRLGSEAWQELLRRHASSGEPVSTFCQREGVTTHSYRRWKLRLADKVPTPPRATPKKVNTVTAPPFIDLGPIDTAPATEVRFELRLDLGGGLTLHLVRG